MAAEIVVMESGTITKWIKSEGFVSMKAFNVDGHYQVDEQVTSMAFSKSGIELASGSSNGNVNDEHAVNFWLCIIHAVHSIDKKECEIQNGTCNAQR